MRLINEQPPSHIICNVMNITSDCSIPFAIQRNFLGHLRYIFCIQIPPSTKGMSFYHNKENLMAVEWYCLHSKKVFALRMLLIFFFLPRYWFLTNNNSSFSKRLSFFIQILISTYSNDLNGIL